jgi:hypothetical protein
MDFLVSRSVVVGLAIIGAIASTVASMLEARQKINASRARQLNRAGYVAMGISMLLFIIAGFRT